MEIHIGADIQVSHAGAGSLQACRPVETGAYRPMDREAMVGLFSLFVGMQGSCPQLMSPKETFCLAIHWCIISSMLGQALRGWDLVIHRIPL